MKTQRLSQVPRILIIVLMFALLLTLTGGMPAAATAPKQSSYIIQATNTELAEQLVSKHGGSITSRLDIIHAVGANLSDESVKQLRLEKGILAITPNSAVNSSDNGKDKSKDNGNGNDKEKKFRATKNAQNVPSTDYPNVVGADIVWGEGTIGSGIAVAVLDTGLGDLPSLTQTVKNKSGRIVAWKDFIDNSKKPIDPNGHGSHVAGIIANSEKGTDGEWNGIAPGVNLVGVRVLDESGAGSYESVISGLQWVIENKSRYNIRVVNLSLVSQVQSPYWADPLNQAVTQAWASGLTVIVAAGNSGPQAMSISVPGNNPYVVTVGAFTDNFTPADWSDDYIAPFSSAGPTLDGFSKPDVVAPGAHMLSPIPANSFLTKEYPSNQLSDNYFSLAGTSQATAVISGIAALVISNNPHLTPDQVKNRLTSTAYPWIDNSGDVALYSMWQQGAGRASAPEAVFSDSTDASNQGMDIRSDLTGKIHYEGFAYYDETTGTYRLRAPFDEWAGGYGTWDGKYGVWSGKYGVWSGKYGVWSGKYGVWSGKYGVWSGGYSVWSGKYGVWSGSEDISGSLIADPTFIANFAAGLSPDASISNATTSFFTEDPNP